MEEKYRDSLNFLGLGMTTFALIETKIFVGWKYLVMLFALIIFLLFAVCEIFKKDNKKFIHIKIKDD